MDPVVDELDIWEYSNVQGFSFDDIESKDFQLYSDALAKNISGKTVEANYTPSLANDDCAFCTQRLGDYIKFEDRCAFCSEGCWISCLKSSLTDLRCGGISSWPIDLFVSLDAKRKMVELASETLDGDFILKVIQIIRAKLDRDVFFSIILENDLCYKHYILFLNETDQTADVKNLLHAHGNIEDAKLFSFKNLIAAAQVPIPEEAEKAMHKLRLYSVTDLAPISSLTVMNESTTQAAELIQFQLKINAEWIAFLNAATYTPISHIISELGGTLLGQNLANTILAVTIMDKRASSGSRADQLRKKFNMSDEHYRWLVLEPLVLQSQWMEIDLILLEKKWLPRKSTPSLPIDRLILFLNSTKTPKSAISRFIQYMSDAQSLVDLVCRMELYDVGMEYFIQRKDVSGMKNLLSRTPTNREEFSVGQAYLGKPTNQWSDYYAKE